MRVGHIAEWHLVFAKAFQHLAFGLVSWFHETIVRFGPALFSARFIPGARVSGGYPLLARLAPDGKIGTRWQDAQALGRWRSEIRLSLSPHTQAAATKGNA